MEDFCSTAAASSLQHFLQAKLGAFAELQAIAKGLGENDATGFVNLESHGICNGKCIAMASP